MISAVGKKKQLKTLLCRLAFGSSTPVFCLLPPLCTFERHLASAYFVMCYIAVWVLFNGKHFSDPVSVTSAMQINFTEMRHQQTNQLI